MTEPDNELEIAIWYDANEHLDPINSCSESIKDLLEIMCTKRKVIRGGVSYEVLYPGDDRVPPVPHWLENINGVVPRLLVATSEIVSSGQQEPIGIIGDLDKKDIARLRIITRRAHHRSYPHDTRLADHECDQIIDKLGLEVVMDQLRSNVVH